MLGTWIDLRDECDRLYARLDIETGRIEARVNGRTRIFDVLATLREHRPALFCSGDDSDHRQADKISGE